MFGWPWFDRKDPAKTLAGDLAYLAEVIKARERVRDTRMDVIVDRLKVMLKSKDQARTRDLIRMLIADIGRMA